MIQKVSSLIVADHILNTILNDDRAIKFDGFVKTLNNGREQGYSVFSGRNYSNSQAISFTQDRNSDLIVVYKGIDDGGIPTCRGDYGKKDFQSKDYDAVVDYVFDLLERVNK